MVTLFTVKQSVISVFVFGRQSSITLTPLISFPKKSLIKKTIGAIKARVQLFSDVITRTGEQNEISGDDAQAPKTDPVIKIYKSSRHCMPGLPDFSWYSKPKREKIYRTTTKYTKWP
jgi:hypothetical protein